MAGHECNKKVKRAPGAKIHWQALHIYRAGQEILGEERLHALRQWIMAEDMTLYVPWYRPENIDTTGLDVPRARKAWKEAHHR